MDPAAVLLDRGGENVEAALELPMGAVLVERAEAAVAGDVRINDGGLPAQKRAALGVTCF